MSAVIESQLSSAPISQVTKEGCRGEGGENDNEDVGKGKQQRGERKNEDTQVVKGRDGGGRAELRETDKKDAEQERFRDTLPGDRRKQRSQEMRESNYRKNEESISIDLCMSIPSDTRGLLWPTLGIPMIHTITGIHNLYRQQGQLHLVFLQSAGGRRSRRSAATTCSLA